MRGRGVGYARSVAIHSSPSHRLVVFTRYPEPGRTKSRLIPAIGADGAARLSRALTEHTLERMAALRAQSGVEIEVRYAGGDQHRMRGWLGDVPLVAQGEGDLGARMARALDSGWRAGRSATVIIGTDAPALDAARAGQAFAALSADGVDLVIGPAADGGYYLIGTKRPQPQLFVDVAWGCPTVLARTLEIADRLGLRLVQLPVERDVDRPEDLEVLRSFPRLLASAGQKATPRFEHEREQG